MNKQAIFKNGSTTYYYSSLFFPPEVKDAVFSLYAFVRTADNFVDAIPQQKKDLAAFEADTKQAFSQQEARSSIIHAYVEMAKQYKITWEMTNDFFSAMRADLTKHSYATYKELEGYMYGSAEVIGLMMSAILGLPKESNSAAQYQGQAMQLINFIRDIKEDIDLGRQYIPTEDMKRFKLTRLIPQSAAEKEAFCQLIRFEIERYYKLQSKALQGYKWIPARYRIPIKTAADLYSWTAKEIEKNPLIVFEKKVKPRPWRVIMTVIKNYCLVSP